MTTTNNYRYQSYDKESNEIGNSDNKKRNQRCGGNKKKRYNNKRSNVTMKEGNSLNNNGEFYSTNNSHNVNPSIPANSGQVNHFESNEGYTKNNIPSAPVTIHNVNNDLNNNSQVGILSNSKDFDYMDNKDNISNKNNFKHSMNSSTKYGLNNHGGENTGVTETIERSNSNRNPSKNISNGGVSYKREIYSTKKDTTTSKITENNSNKGKTTPRSSIGSIQQFKSSKTKPVYEISEFQKSFRNTPNFRNDSINNNVTIERYITHNNQKSFNKNRNDLIPTLKAHKAYDISFTLDNVVNTNKTNLKNIEKRQIETIEYSSKSNERKDINKYENRTEKDDKKIQTENFLLSDNSKTSTVQFEDLMKDVDLNKIQNENKNNTTYDITDGRRGGGYERTKERSLITNQTNDNNTNATNKSMNISDMIYSDNAGNGNIATSEVSEVKEWMIVQYPDNHQERREFRKVINEDGDVNYIDIDNGSILKVDKASWKSGEEYIKDGRNTKKIAYEWRKDPNSNSWVKYNSETNEIITRGDWKNGTEMIRNSKGKFEQRNYSYKKNQNGQWIKVDPSSGKMIDFSSCTALSGYEWILPRNQKNKKLKDRRWKKREYKYVQNNKGNWEKIDQETTKKIGKPTKYGWKEGIDHHMDKSGKVKPVHYIWDIKGNGEMEKIDKKTKEPVNSMWKEGREIIMRGDVVNTTNFAWVEVGKNKWVKLDQENGAPVTGEIKSNNISSQIMPNQSSRRSLVTKTTKKIDNEKIVQEDTKIEQNQGGVIKNVTRTTKFVK